MEAKVPTAGTHITILERIALTGEFQTLIGDLDADEGTAAGKRMKFAKLGAVGPDIFYALMDYNPELQSFTNFMSKLSGSIECITDLTKRIDTKIAEVEADITLGTSTYFKQAIDEFQKTFGLITALVHEGLMAWAIQQGGNLFPIFEARRQQNQSRTAWFWADYLHYVRTGQFVRELFVQSEKKPNVRAFAYGYLTHYVTDVVGHPFINQVVGSPWRMYWQRHHLVENFVDGYVWDRWHDAHVGETDPSSGEQLLDSIRGTPHASIGKGAPFTFARLNDHINIGTVAGNDPIDSFVRDICDKIRNDLENMGVLEKVPDPPDDADLNEWADTLAQVFRAAYPPSADPPTNLMGGGRPDGYPTPDDIKQAYSLLRLYLRISTEENVTEPEFPDLAADVWNAVKQVWDDVEKKLGSAPPFPSPGIPGSFEDLWEAMKRFLDWAVKTAILTAEVAFDLIKGAIKVAGTLLLDMIRAGLYLVKKALFDIYKYFRFFLVRAAYTIPFTNELTDEVGGGIFATSLWTTPRESTLYSYPKEELADIERRRFPSHYVPWVPPELLADMRAPHHVLIEQPQTWVGPYGAGMPADAFIEPPVGGRIMLSPQGPMSFNVLVTPGTPFQPPTDFGGAIGNCIEAFRKVIAAESGGNIPKDLFPDYNLDGDRGYGWPCWNVRHPPGSGGPFDSLDPPAGGIVTVDPVLIP
jgi:hypothetical protein